MSSKSFSEQADPDLDTQTKPNIADTLIQQGEMEDEGYDAPVKKGSSKALLSRSAQEREPVTEAIAYRSSTNQISPGDLLRLFGFAVVFIVAAIAIIVMVFPSKDSNSVEAQATVKTLEQSIKEKDDTIKSLQANPNAPIGQTPLPAEQSAQVYNLGDPSKTYSVTIKTDLPNVYNITIDTKDGKNFGPHYQDGIALTPGVYKISFRVGKTARFTRHIVVADQNINITVPISTWKE